MKNITTLKPKAIENPVNMRNIGKVIEKNIESSTLSVRTIKVLTPIGIPFFETIFILTGSPPADEGVIAATNMLEKVILREYLNGIL